MLRKNNRSYATSALCWLVGLCLLASQIQLGQIALGQDFASQIKPILANHCWSCHGPDEQSRKADLRLDRRDDALSAKSIVPGKASESPLAERIDSTDPDSVMPPPETKKPLTEQQRQLLKDWIDAGAKYSQHWSFAPPD
ncbi:MAG: c-type cytochrome domain-containing protein, partial [Pirellula sp.]